MNAKNLILTTTVKGYKAETAASSQWRVIRDGKTQLPVWAMLKLHYPYATALDRLVVENWMQELEASDAFKESQKHAVCPAVGGYCGGYCSEFHCYTQY